MERGNERKWISSQSALKEGIEHTQLTETNSLGKHSMVREKLVALFDCQFTEGEWP